MKTTATKTKKTTQVKKNTATVETATPTIAPFVLPESAKNKFLEVERDLIDPSVTNPRKYFHPERGAELAVAAELRAKHDAQKKTDKKVDSPKAAEQSGLGKNLGSETSAVPALEDKFVKKVPLLSSSYYRHDKISKDVLCRDEFKEITNKKQACEFAEYGVWESGDKLGAKQLICRSKNCGLHFAKSSSGSGNANKPSREEYLKRKQELFDMRVAEPVRVEVFRQGAAEFNAEKWIFADDFFRELLIAKLCVEIFTGGGNKHQAKIIREHLGLDETALSGESSWMDSHDERVSKMRKKINALTFDQQSKLLYLATVVSFGENVNPQKFLSQDRVLELAAHQNINYVLIDAQKQVEVAEAGALPKKFRPAAKQYLAQVEAAQDKESSTSATDTALKRPKYFEDEGFQAENDTMAKTKE